VFETAETEMRKSTTIAIGLAWGIAVFFVAALIADSLGMSHLQRGDLGEKFFIVLFIFVLGYRYVYGKLVSRNE
jgi:hypothetical protein